MGIRNILTNLQCFGPVIAATVPREMMRGIRTFATRRFNQGVFKITKRLKIMSLNKVMLIGNVGKDPEVRYLDGNNNPNSGSTKVATFTLATTERYRDRNGELRENTEWHNIVAWRNSADVAEKYIRKGTQVYIEGKLRTRSWTDQTGNKRYTTEVTVDNLQLLGRKSDNPGAQDGGQGYGQTQGGYQPQGQQGYGQPALRQAQGPVSGPAQGPAYAQPQYQQGGYQPSQQPVQQPQQQTPVNPIEVAAADMPQDDLPF